MKNFYFFLPFSYFIMNSTDFILLSIIFLFGILFFFRNFYKEEISILSFFISLIFCKYFQYEIEEKVLFFVSYNLKGIFLSFLIMYLTIFFEYIILKFFKKKKVNF